MVVDRPDKEQVIFYRDPNLDLQVDEGEGGGGRGGEWGARAGTYRAVFHARPAGTVAQCECGRHD